MHPRIGMVIQSTDDCTSALQFERLSCENKRAFCRDSFQHRSRFKSFLPVQTTPLLRDLYTNSSPRPLPQTLPLVLFREPFFYVSLFSLYELSQCSARFFTLSRGTHVTQPSPWVFAPDGGSSFFAKTWCLIRKRSQLEDSDFKETSRECRA